MEIPPDSDWSTLPPRKPSERIPPDWAVRVEANPNSAKRGGPPSSRWQKIQTSALASRKPSWWTEAMNTPYPQKPLRAVKTYDSEPAGTAEDDSGSTPQSADLPHTAGSCNSAGRSSAGPSAGLPDTADLRSLVLDESTPIFERYRAMSALSDKGKSLQAKLGTNDSLGDRDTGTG
jgi:hypothetical protein